MALSYPEGEVFFKTKDLQVKSSNPDDWKASVPGDFYGYFLLEYQGNCAVDWGSGGNLPPMKSHPRSDYVREKASNYSTTFAWWHHVGVSIGKHDDIKRRFNIHMNPNVNAYKDRDRGGPKIIWVHPCPMPSTHEEWMWIDCLVDIRGIYLPLAQKADSQFPDMCSYAYINFYQQPKRSVWHSNYKRFYDIDFPNLGGLGYWKDWSFGINVPECIKLLTLSRQLRGTNIWDEKLVMFRPRDDVMTVGAVGRPYVHMDFVDIVNSSFAVALQWKPVPAPNNPFVLQLLQTVLSAGLGLIPGVGPLASAMFSVAWEAMRDPDAFEKWATEGGWALTMIQAVMGSAPSMSKYVHNSWKTGGGTSLSFGGLNASSRVVESDEDEKPIDLDTIGPSPVLLAGLRLITEPQKAPNAPNGNDKLELPLLLRARRTNAISLEDALALQQALEGSHISSANERSNEEPENPPH